MKKLALGALCFAGFLAACGGDDGTVTPTTDARDIDAEVVTVCDPLAAAGAQGCAVGQKCTGPSDCATGACNGAVCVYKAQGLGCANNNECGAAGLNFCVDGVCCNTSCTNGCMACFAPTGTVGSMRTWAAATGRGFCTRVSRGTFPRTCPPRCLAETCCTWAAPTTAWSCWPRPPLWTSPRPKEMPPR